MNICFFRFVLEQRTKKLARTDSELARKLLQFAVADSRI